MRQSIQGGEEVKLRFFQNFIPISIYNDPRPLIITSHNLKKLNT